MTSLYEIQCEMPLQHLAEVGPALEGDLLERYVDRHGTAYVALRGPGGPWVERSAYVRQGEVFWIPPGLATKHAGAGPWVSLIFIDETDAGFAVAVVQGNVHQVSQGERTDWMRLDPTEVYSAAPAGFQP